MQELYIGLMSGTSLDGVDGVLVDFAASRPQILQHCWQSLAPGLAAELLALNQPGPDELHRAALAANALARAYASVVQALLATGGLSRSDVVAVGAHGQTVRHRPGEFDATGYTLQLNNPALLAELVGIDVVADFRSRDVAAGGQGAPLVPLFHQALFGQEAHTVCVLNIGGIANLTVLDPARSPLGFDCGPGNALMDHWCRLHTGQAFDKDGRWAAGGVVVDGLLRALMDEAYLRATPPKSTGRDLFNPAWLSHRLQHGPEAAPANVQATLLEFTARVCADSVLGYATGSTMLLVCGGGALNLRLMERLAACLPTMQVRSTGYGGGMDPMQVEATAFAWLARRTLKRDALALQNITGAKGARVLGCVYPA
jgi:anhydro-N-acetylmuramic acid kinase